MPWIDVGTLVSGGPGGVAWVDITGKPAVIAAGADAATARAAIGAGTSNLVLGTTTGSALPGDSTPATIGAATAAQGALADTAVQPARKIQSGTGLTGGGDLGADRTLTVSYGTAAGTAAQGNDSRFVGVTITDKSASYTLTAADAGAVIRSTAASAITITVPNSTFAAGNIIEIMQYGAGQITVAAGSGVTLRSTATAPLKTSAQYAAVSILMLSASEAVVTGGLA